LLGAPRRGSGNHAYNSVYLLGRDGEIQGLYDKQLLVPFGEYDPFASLGRIPGAEDVTYAAGRAAAPLGTESLKVGTLICYEILFPSLVNDLVRQGADVLVNVSNDSWMDAGDGAAPEQHFSMATFRAVETRRYLVRASSGGTSGFVDPYGRRYAEIAAGTAGGHVAAIRRQTELTPYVRFGDAWIPALALILALASAWSRMSRLHTKVVRRRRRAPNVIPLRDFSAGTAMRS
jgi:apolipoprotein N-acyltransferase